MISVNIGNKKVPLPQELSLDKFKKVIKYDLSDIDNWYMILNDVLEVEEMDKANEEVIQMLIGFLISSLNNRTECNIINLEELSFGQFIDLEVYLANDRIKHIDDITNILAPSATTHDKALWAMEKWLQWREVVFRQYKGLFEISDNEDEQEDNKIPSTHKHNHVAKTWFKTLIDLANDDILKIKEIEVLPFRLCFNFMANKKEERKIKEMEMLKNKRLNEIHRRSK